MNSNKMCLSLIPWAAFSVIINRRGADAAAIAALAAAALSLFFLVRESQKGGVKGDRRHRHRDLRCIGPHRFLRRAVGNQLDR
jgi:hypothetical protein